MKKFKIILSLFWTMFKIGLFTFGGGYAMIAIIERELVEKKEWLTHDEFMDVVAIAESSPGPLAINSSTFIGYKLAGVLGSIFATLAVCIPSFVIIFVISLFFDAFIQIEWVGYAFQGIRACVAYLILSAGIKMFKHLKKNFFNLALFVAAGIVMILFTIFSVNFSSIFYVLIGGGIGLVVYLIGLIVKRDKSKDATEKGGNE
ncbi:MAG: chromate transporter [Clostridiales bacterium]|nr:chromate transporter [Clostridiales bacterium]